MAVREAPQRCVRYARSAPMVKLSTCAVSDCVRSSAADHITPVKNVVMAEVTADTVGVALGLWPARLVGPKLAESGVALRRHGWQREHISAAELAEKVRTAVVMLSDEVVEEFGPWSVTDGAFSAWSTIGMARFSVVEEDDAFTQVTPRDEGVFRFIGGVLLLVRGCIEVAEPVNGDGK